MNGWITVEQAAILVGRTRATVYVWIKQGRLPTVRPDRITMVRRRDVVQLEAVIKMGRPEGTARTRRAG
jgi:excisionase family DNA binding protein